jgi:lysophospholipase L1-like esterase
MRCWYAFILVMLLGGGCRAHAQVDDPQVLKEVVARFFRGIEEKDTVSMRRVTTDDFVLYEEGLVWNLDSGNANIRRNLPFTVKYVLSDWVVHVDEHSGDARYNNHADFAFDDTVSRSFDWVESATFRKGPEGWKINFLSVARHRGFAAPRYDTVRFAREHYAERVAAFRMEPVKQGGTVLLGNSLTEYGNWKRLLGDSDVVNRGIAADNTFGMLDRLDEVIARRPKEVFIEAGINDVAQGVPAGRIIANILVIIGKLRLACPGVRIYVTSVLPTNDDARKEYPEVAGKNAVVEELDKDLERAVKERNVVYIDLASGVRDVRGNLDKQYAALDGLHLNSAGYAVWIGLIRKMRADAR